MLFFGIQQNPGLNWIVGKMVPHQSDNSAAESLKSGFFIMTCSLSGQAEETFYISIFLEHRSTGLLREIWTKDEKTCIIPDHFQHTCPQHFNCSLLFKEKIHCLLWFCWNNGYKKNIWFFSPSWIYRWIAIHKNLWGPYHLFYVWCHGRNGIRLESYLVYLSSIQTQDWV